MQLMEQPHKKNAFIYAMSYTGNENSHTPKKKCAVTLTD